jgi:hypothetical protein
VTDSVVLLGGMMALFVGTFVWLTWLTHARFGSFGFDLGIFDQGVWLLSRLRDPFVTIRGLPLFGDHASYILVLVAPLYWLWADPHSTVHRAPATWISSARLVSAGPEQTQSASSPSAKLQCTSSQWPRPGSRSGRMATRAQAYRRSPLAPWPALRRRQAPAGSRAASWSTRSKQNRPDTSDWWG